MGNKNRDNTGDISQHTVIHQIYLILYNVYTSYFLKDMYGAMSNDT